MKSTKSGEEGDEGGDAPNLTAGPMAALQANLSDLAPTLDFSSFDMSDGYIETALKVIGFFIPSPTTVAYAIYFCRGNNVFLSS